MSHKQWEALANYQSIELVQREHKLRHGRTLNIQRAREIAAPFTNARSYFRSASNAEQTIKPLLLYYGVVNLSRGLTLMLSGLPEATLAHTHGLSVKNWVDELGKPHPDFAALQVRVDKRGSFVELAKATAHRSPLRGGHCPTVNFTWQIPQIPDGAAFSLGDVLARIPALQEHHVRWRNLILCGTFEKEALNLQEVEVRISKADQPQVTRSFCDALFTGTAFTFARENNTDIFFKGPDDVDALPGLTDFTNPLTIGISEFWLTARYPGNVRLSKLTTAFALSYMLGTLVRYWPTQWTALVQGQIKDAALPTIAAAIALIENDFPLLILDCLNEKISMTMT